MYQLVSIGFRKALSVFRKIGLITTPMTLRLRGIKVGQSCSFFGLPISSLHPDSSIRIGNANSFISKPSMTALGVSHPVVLRTLLPGASITIADNSGFSGCSICSATSIDIGNGVLIGADAIIADTDFHPIHPNRRYAPLKNASSKSITIEDDVFIGARAIVLKGVTIGKGSVIGAGSVVTRSCPPMSVIAGNPARIIATIPNETEEMN